jgi:hypothetical protein
MKKITLILTVILMAIAVSGQIKGIDLDNVVEVKNENELENHPEQWIKIPAPDGVYTFFIENTNAVDYKHLITELDCILQANDLDINKPDQEDDLLPSEIKGLRDYDNLSYYVALGKAEIMRSYNLDDEWVIGIICNYQVRALGIGKR